MKERAAKVLAIVWLSCGAQLLTAQGPRWAAAISAPKPSDRSIAFPVSRCDSTSVAACKRLQSTESFGYRLAKPNASPLGWSDSTSDDRPRNARRGLMIGLVVGAAIGYFSGGRCDDRASCNEAGIGAAVLGLGGAIVGAFVGTAWPTSSDWRPH